MCCHHEYLQRYVRREFQNAATRVINNIKVIISDGRCQFFHWLFGLTINASVRSFINFGVVILGLHQKTEGGLDMNFLFEMTEVTSVELYRNDFGIDTAERHSAL